MAAAAGRAHAQADVAPPAGTPEPEVKRQVHEDDRTRIEELRVRGQVRRIVVTPKGSDMRPYEILPPDPAEPAGAAEPRRGGAWQRVWQLLRL